MLPLVRRDRCKKCTVERALRQCPRTNKQFCWKCCNELRIDTKCPDSCPYKPLFSEANPFPAFKADTLKEENSALQRYIDLWIVKENEHFTQLSPLQYASQDKDQMLKWLSGFQYPTHFPIAYLMQKLKLSYQQEAATDDPETIVGAYLDHLISLDYASLNSLTANKSILQGISDRYGELIAKIAYLKKVKRYSYIHTGLSEDAAQALVFVELNLKDEFTFVLRNENGSWVIRQLLNGNPALYFKQNDLYKNIAQYLGNGDVENAFNEIAEALRSYPDSSDLYYYRGIYWLMVKQAEKAKADFYDSIALDNSFAPPYMNLGLLHLSEKDYSEAKLWFASLVQIQPDNPDAINNLAIAHIAMNEKDAALALWNNLIKTFPTYENAKKNLELYG